MEREIVAAPENLFFRDIFIGAILGLRARMYQNLHSEGLGHAGNGPAYAAIAVHAKCFAEYFEHGPLEVAERLAFYPVARIDGGAVVVGAALCHKQQCKHVLAYGVCGITGHIAADYAAFVKGGKVNIVVTRGVRAHILEFRAVIDKLARHVDFVYEKHLCVARHLKDFLFRKDVVEFYVTERLYYRKIKVARREGVRVK